LPPRAAILARDGTPLAKGPDRSSPVSDVAGQIVGELGTPPPAERLTRRAEGYPASALVGTTGLERALERRLAGRPGGVLKAGRRTLARTRPRPAGPVRTSLDVGLERAAIAGLAGRLGGATAIDPRTGEILALAGVAYSALQPPGSTFKIITAEAALQAGQVKLADPFPVQTGAVLEGRTLSNANGEACGGTFLHSFAESCNSVFAPLGAKVGGRRLVAAAERFGFNHPIDIPGAATSTIPSAAEIGGPLAVGSSAIGQGRVQATSLQMALVAATVAAGGRRPVPTLLARARPAFVTAFPRTIARTLRRLMLAVVQGGTGTAAQIPGVEVAGKTGTAELQDTAAPTEPGQPAARRIDTDAWFVAFAPARRPRVAVGVLLVQAGAGGAVAAPAARQILVAGLKRR
jgi:cell division protein FtsI/penicillin-binding protein 2